VLDIRVARHERILSNAANDTFMLAMYPHMDQTESSSVCYGSREAGACCNIHPSEEDGMFNAKQLGERSRYRRHFAS
jgi:hypothetical protein